MGYSASSYVIFGKQVSKSELTVVTNVRSCPHNTDTSKKFCSECGNPIWKEEEVFVADEGYGNNLGFFASTAETNKGIFGFKLTSTDLDDNGYYAIPEPTPEMALAILEFFKKHNQSWPRDELKTYLYTHHSY